MSASAIAFVELPFGLSWVMAEPMRRASHALATPAGVWLVDPVDEPAALERVAALGPAAGVVQLLDRHRRDGAAIAARLGVPHLRLPAAAGPFEVVRVIDLPGWRELALWWPARSVLVVAEAVGTSGYFVVPGRRAGMHPLLRPAPPGALRGREPAHLLVGHGRPVIDDGAAALRDAYEGARRDLPRLAAKLPRLIRGR